MAETTQTKSERQPRRMEIGVVTSANKSPQTLKVEVGYRVRHPKYGKFVRRRQKLTVHDPKREAKAGDRVEVMQCRPISKTKTWRLVRIVESAPA